jgi:hypothetical protein
MTGGDGNERSAGRKLLGVITGVGLAIALLALFGTGLSGVNDALMVLFWCGWGVVGGAMLAGLFMVKMSLPLDGPFRVIQFGIATVILGLVMESLSGLSMRPLWSLGAATMFAGIGWALWSIGGMRE